MSIKMHNITNNDFEVAIYIPNSFINIKNLNFMINFFNKRNIKFFILVRSILIFKKLKNYKTIYAKKPYDIEKVIKEYSSLKKVYFIKHHTKNIHLSRYVEIEHIFIATNSILIDKSYRQYDTLLIDKNINLKIDTRHLKIINYLEESLNNR